MTAAPKKPVGTRVKAVVGKFGKAIAGVALTAAALTTWAAPANAAPVTAASATPAAQSVIGGTLTTTDTHPFHDITQSAFVSASDLNVGDDLQSTDGVTLTTTGLRDYHTSTVTYDLTIDGLHTYYVEAGADPILVHNCDLSDWASEISCGT